MVPRNPYPSLEPKTSTWKMLVSIGWFQIFTCKMVVSPFPSIRNRIYPMNTHVKKDVLCLLRGPHPKGFPTILGGLRWSSAHWYGANVGVGASWNSNRSSYKEGQAGWNPKIFSLEYDVVTSLSYVLGLLCFWICRLFFGKKWTNYITFFKKNEGRHYREFRRFLQAFTAAAPFTLSQPCEAQIDWDLFHCESPAAMELADLVVPVVDRKTGGYFFVVLKGSHIWPQQKTRIFQLEIRDAGET